MVPKVGEVLCTVCSVRTVDTDLLRLAPLRTTVGKELLNFLHTVFSQHNALRVYAVKTLWALRQVEIYWLERSKVA